MGRRASGSCIDVADLAAPIPTTAIITKSYIAVCCNRHRILKLDEAPPWMLHCRLDGDDHVRFQLAILIVPGVGEGTGAGQARALVADQSHSVSEEIRIGEMSGRFDHLIR